MYVGLYYRMYVSFSINYSVLQFINTCRLYWFNSSFPSEFCLARCPYWSWLKTQNAYPVSISPCWMTAVNGRTWWTFVRQWRPERRIYWGSQSMSRYGAWCGRGVPLMPSINLPVRRGRVVVATDCDCLKNCPFVLIQRVAQVCQRGARLSAGRWYDSGTGQSRAGLGAWHVAFDTGPSQTLLCFWVQFDLRLQLTKIVQDMICAKFLMTWPIGRDAPVCSYQFFDTLP